MSHSQMSQSLFCRHRHLHVFLFHLRIRNSPIHLTSSVSHQTSCVILQPDMVQGERYRVQRLFPLRWLQLALPYRDAMPAHLSQFALFFLITLLVPANLRHPELTIGSWNLAARGVLNYALCIMNYALNIVSMPKAPIHEDACPILSQHQVWMPRQPFMIQSVPESSLPQTTTYNQLWLRILASNRCHVG